MTRMMHVMTSNGFSRKCYGILDVFLVVWFNKVTTAGSIILLDFVDSPLMVFRVGSEFLRNLLGQLGATWIPGWSPVWQFFIHGGS